MAKRACSGYTAPYFAAIESGGFLRGTPAEDGRYEPPPTSVWQRLRGR